MKRSLKKYIIQPLNNLASKAKLTPLKMCRNTRHQQFKYNVSKFYVKIRKYIQIQQVYIKNLKCPSVCVEVFLADQGSQNPLPLHQTRAVCGVWCLLGMR